MVECQFKYRARGKEIVFVKEDLRLMAQIISFDALLARTKNDPRFSLGRNSIVKNMPN